MEVIWKASALTSHISNHIQCRLMAGKLALFRLMAGKLALCHLMAGKLVIFFTAIITAEEKVSA